MEKHLVKFSRMCPTPEARSAIRFSRLMNGMPKSSFGETMRECRSSSSTKTPADAVKHLQDRAVELGKQKKSEKNSSTSFFTEEEVLERAAREKLRRKERKKENKRPKENKTPTTPTPDPVAEKAKAAVKTEKAVKAKTTGNVAIIMIMPPTTAAAVVRVPVNTVSFTNAATAASSSTKASTATRRNEMRQPRAETAAKTTGILIVTPDTHLPVARSSGADRQI
jgi:hypothetical protein